MSDAGDAPEVGPLAEEAAKLFRALSGWARDHVGEANEGLSGLADQAASAVHDIDEHLATGSAECTVCPLCRTVHAVRHLSPEVADLAVQGLTTRDESSAINALSVRERQIAELVVRGRSSTEIGALLHLSPKTVDSYRSRLMGKLEVADVPALVRLAIREGLISADEV